MNTALRSESFLDDAYTTGLPVTEFHHSISWSSKCLSLTDTRDKFIHLPGIGTLSRKYSGRGVKLTTHHNLVSRLEMRGAPPTLPHVFMAWCSIQYQE